MPDLPRPAGLARLDQPAEHSPLAQAPRRQTARRPDLPVAEPDGTTCRLLASEVDHIRPLAAGGDRWDWDNLQSQILCNGHHLEKTATENRRRPR